MTVQSTEKNTDQSTSFLNTGTQEINNGGYITPSESAKLTTKAVSLVKEKIYSADQIIKCEDNFEKLITITSEQVVGAIKSKKLSAEDALTWEPSVTRLLTSQEIVKAIKRDGKVEKAIETGQNVLDKVKGLAGMENKANTNSEVYTAKELSKFDEQKILALTTNQTIQAINNSIYSKEQLLSYDTQTIKALTNPFILQLIKNKTYTKEQLTKLDVESLEAFIARITEYNNQDAIEKLGKTYFYVLSKREADVRNTISNNKEDANNNDNYESPLSLALHTHQESIAHFLIGEGGHFNHKDFAMQNSTYSDELKTLITHSLSQNEQQKAFIKFHKIEEVTRCEKSWNDHCLIEATASTETKDEL